MTTASGSSTSNAAVPLTSSAYCMLATHSNVEGKNRCTLICPNQDDKDRLCKFFNHQRGRLVENSIASIPDQGNVEYSKWIMKEKTTFEGQILQMKTEFDLMMGNPNGRRSRKWNTYIESELDKFVKKWREQSMIDLILIREGEGKAAKYTNGYQIDFRPSKILYNAHANNNICNRANAEDIGRRMLDNLEKLIPAVASKSVGSIKNDVVLSQVSLKAWGTYPQPVHTDYYSTHHGRNSPNAGEIPPHSMTATTPEEWQGTMIYRFVEDGEAKSKAPTIGWIPKNGCRKRLFNIEHLENGYVTLLGPELEHCGGVSKFPHILLEVNFERKHMPRYRHFQRTFFHVVEGDKLSSNAQRMRKRRLSNGTSNSNKRRHYETSIALRKNQPNDSSNKPPNQAGPTIVPALTAGSKCSGPENEM